MHLIVDIIGEEQVLSVTVCSLIINGIETIWICGEFSEGSRNKVDDAVTKLTALKITVIQGTAGFSSTISDALMDTQFHQPPLSH